jgi:uncharacterized protein YkwD
MNERIKIIALAAAIIISSPFIANAADGTTSSGRAKEIYEKWYSLKPVLPQGYMNYDEKLVYEIFPSIIKPYAAGKLQSQFLKDALNSANLVRYMAYLPSDLVMSETLTNQAQHGATLLASIGQLTHYPYKPEDMSQEFYDLGYKCTTSSNLGAGYVSIVHSIVDGYMRDADNSNIDRVGHRRWVLNPPLKQVGFGFASGDKGYGRYTSMQVFDRSRAEAVNYDFTAWPSQKAFPLEYFSGNDPWSVSLDSNIYDNSKVEELSVKIIRKSDNKEWLFNKNSTGDYRFFVNTAGYGVPYCIIFRPPIAEIGTIKENTAFEVHIDGVYDLQGNKKSIKYDTSFFKLSTLEKADVQKDADIDISDLAAAAKNYNKSIGDSTSTTNCDLNNDGVIDIYDLAGISRYI